MLQSGQSGVQIMAKTREFSLLQIVKTCFCDQTTS